MVGEFILDSTSVPAHSLVSPVFIQLNLVGSDAVARYAAAAPEGVTAIAWKADGPHVRIRTVIPQADPLLQQRVYAAELETIDAFPGLSLDFVVLFQAGREAEALIPAEWNRAQVRR